MTAVLLACWLALSHARADVMVPAPPCPPGTSDEPSGTVSGGRSRGYAGHGRGPRCEPLLCRDDSTCGPDRICRTDSHCLASRDRLEHPEGPPGGPAPAPIVTNRILDLRRCGEDGSCPADARCMSLSWCQPTGELDPAPLEEPRAPSPAAPVWTTAAVPFGSPPWVPPGLDEPVVAGLDEPVVVPRPAATAPAPSSCTCRAACRPRSGSAIWILLGAAWVWSLRARR